MVNIYIALSCPPIVFLHGYHDNQSASSYTPPGPHLCMLSDSLCKMECEIYRQIVPNAKCHFWSSALCSD